MPRASIPKAITLILGLFFVHNGVAQVPETSKQNSMRIILDNFSLEIPRGFSDQTTYLFKEPRQREELGSTFGSRPPEAFNLESMLAIRRERLTSIFPETVKIGPESDARIGGLPARMFSFTFTDGKVVSIGQWAVAFPSPQEYMQISYRAPASDSQAVQRFQHILHSVVPAPQTPPREQSPGFKRRWAGRMSFDVPLTLFPPSVYVFARPDGIRLELGSYDPSHSPPQAWGPFQNLALPPGPHESISAKKEDAVNSEDAKGTITGYLLSNPNKLPPSTNSIRQAAILMTNGVHIRISGRAPAPMTDQLDAAVKELVASLQSTK